MLSKLVTRQLRCRMRCSSQKQPFSAADTTSCVAIHVLLQVYMLSELEPSRELTGGAWYTESQFDAEFIDVLREATCQYISRQKDTTISEIAAFIKSKGLAKVALQDCDVESIVQTLVFDGRVDQVRSACLIATRISVC